MSRSKELANFVWQNAELLRGDFKQSEYGKVILPFVVMRRLDCVLEATKDDVLQAAAGLSEDIDEEMRDLILSGAAGEGLSFYNTSPFTFASLKNQDPTQLHANLVTYVTSFSSNVRDIFLEKFLFTDQLKRLNDAKILYKVFEKFTEIDMHPDRLSNLEMGYLFEDLIRRFSEISNETAGEHFTPREVIRLMVDLLVIDDIEALTKPGIIRKWYDPAAGTGGMLSIGEERILELNSSAKADLYGQELNPESYAICVSDMLVKGHEAGNIGFGNTLTDDVHAGETFHYMLSNPPYGVDWKKYKDDIEAEAKSLGMKGRFGAGLPRVSDGQLLFVQHMISKMRDDVTGSRMAIVMNGSPLFTGGAGSGESEIRRWIIENDWLEAIVALPTDLFYNTGIQTYIWLLTNRKVEKRRGKIQLIDASGERFWKSMRKSLGSKRREIPEDARDLIVKLFGEMLNGDGEYGDISKIFDREAFGYREIRVERPLKLNFQASQERIALLDEVKAFEKLEADEQAAIKKALGTIGDELVRSRPAFEKNLSRVLKEAGLKVGAPIKKAIMGALSERDEEAETCLDKDGNPEPDAELRDHELVPLGEDWREYVAREVSPFVPDAWVDETYRDSRDGEVGRVGYEINFNRHFYKYVPPRPLEEIDEELKQLEAEIAGLLKEVAA